MQQQNSDPNSNYYSQYYPQNNTNNNNNNNNSENNNYAAVSASAPPVFPSDHFPYNNNNNNTNNYEYNNNNSHLAPAPYSFPHLNNNSNSQYYPNNYENTPTPIPNYDYTPGPAFSGNYDYAPGFDSVRRYDPSLYGSGSSGVVFDDYGRPIGSRISKAGPKDEVAENDDVARAGGVENFRARMLSEGAGQREIDILCQIGLDGIKILDPATSRTLGIYPLESVTRWEVLDSYIFAFWAKTTIDMESKRIRLKSNRYTSNNMLDTVTAASFQLKEIGETKKPSDAVKASEQASEKKKGFPDWMNLMKPRNEEKDYWVPDEAVTKCTSCGTDFNAFNRRHHCRNCGDIFCDKCTQGRIELTTDENDVPVRVCDRCLAEVTQRLANVKESAGKVATLQSHADLAKKLKEEMEKNRKTSTGLTLSGSGMRMKDVACPTCTVHLQVRVPSAGSETIECNVCQHPFLVHA